MAEARTLTKAKQLYGNQQSMRVVSKVKDGQNEGEEGGLREESKGGDQLFSQMQADSGETNFRSPVAKQGINRQ